MKLILLILSSFFLISCNSASSPKEDNTDTLKHSDVFNGVYNGITPCADCPGIKMEINFSPDSAFYETLEYIDRNTKFSDTGRWQKSDSIITVFFPGNSNSQNRKFKIINDSSIAMLDGEGHIITGPLKENYILKRSDTVTAR